MTRYFCDFCNEELSQVFFNENSIHITYGRQKYPSERSYLCCDACFEELTNLLRNDTVEEFDIQTNTKTKKKSKAFFKTIKEKIWKKKDELKTTNSKL